MGAGVGKQSHSRQSTGKMVETNQEVDPCFRMNLLLLGSSGSGKSTIFKQMKIMHTNHLDDQHANNLNTTNSKPKQHHRSRSLSLSNNNKSRNSLNLHNNMDPGSSNYSDDAGETPNEVKIEHKSFTTQERSEYAQIIRCQCVHDLGLLVEAAKQLNLLTSDMVEIADLVVQTCTDYLQQLQEMNTNNNNGDQQPENVRALQPEHQQQPSGDHVLIRNKHVWNTMKALWQSEPIQQAFAHCKVHHVMDSTQHFLDQLELIACASYTPSDEDILLAYTHTPEFAHTSFVRNGLTYRIVDTGSSHRIDQNIVDGIDAVIFVVSISDYDNHVVDRHPFATPQNNRLLRALQKFEQTTLNPNFENSAILVVLNKVDVFRQKIRSVDLNVCFPDFTGGCNEAAAIKFLSKKFARVCQPTQPVYVHATNALDMGDILNAFTLVKDFTLCQNIFLSGLV